MKLYGMKMHNFMRFGEECNSIVFNVTKDQKEKIQKGELTFDSLYKAIEDDPIKYVESANTSKDNVLEGIVGIAGMTDGTFDSSNGSGKSTIFEAISYAFYDKVVRQTANTDKKAPAGLSVVTKLSGEYPKNLEESYVEVYFEEDERLYRVKRGRSFAKTKKSSSPILEFDCIKEKEIDKLSSHRKGDTKRSLEEVIVEDYDIFVNTVMFGQADAGKFLVGTDKVKKDMVIELLKLEDLVHGCIDVIRRKKKKESDQLNSLISSSNSLKDLVIKHHNKFNNDEVEYSDDLIDIVTTYIGDSLEERKSKKIELLKSLEKICSEIKELESSEVLRNIERLIGDGKELVNQKKDLVESKEKSLKDWKSVLEENRRSLVVLENEKIDLNKDLSSREEDLLEIQEKLSKINLEEVSKNIEGAKKIIQSEKAQKERQEKIVQANESTIQKISEFNAIINLRNSDLSKLKKQISSTGESETFLCHECHSTVTKEHTLSKVSAIEKVIEDNLKIKKTLLERKEKIDNVAETTKTILRDIEKKKEELRVNTDTVLFYNDSDKSIHDLKSKIENLKSRISDKEKQIVSKNESIQDLINKCSSVEDNFRDRLKDLVIKIKEKREQVVELKSKSSLIEQKISGKKMEKVKVENEVATINNECGSLQEKIDQVVDLGSKISKLEKEIVKSRKQLQRYKILETAFGLEGIQTRIVDNHLPLLNMHVKKFLDILSNGRLSCSLFVNEKSKVDMEITGGTADNYVMLSGGEKMVVRLAVDIGLSLLSLSRTSRTPDLICLDEIFGPLDKEHTKSVFKMLSELKTKFKKVFLISHKSEIQSLIENNIIVEKSSGNRGLSKIVGIQEVTT